MLNFSTVIVLTRGMKYSRETPSIRPPTRGREGWKKSLFEFKHVENTGKCFHCFFFFFFFNFILFLFILYIREVASTLTTTCRASLLICSVLQFGSLFGRSWKMILVIGSAGCSSCCCRCRCCCCWDDWWCRGQSSFATFTIGPSTPFSSFFSRWWILGGRTSSWSWTSARTFGPSYRGFPAAPAASMSFSYKKGKKPAIVVAEVNFSDNTRFFGLIVRMMFRRWIWREKFELSFELTWEFLGIRVSNRRAHFFRLEILWIFLGETWSKISWLFVTQATVEWPILTHFRLCLWIKMFIQETCQTVNEWGRKRWSFGDIFVLSFVFFFFLVRISKICKNLFIKPSRMNRYYFFAPFFSNSFRHSCSAFKCITSVIPQYFLYIFTLMSYW